MLFYEQANTVINNCKSPDIRESPLKQCYVTQLNDLSFEYYYTLHHYDSYVCMFVFYCL